jgi:DNA-binding Xre family transcriptional regulator
MRKIKLRLQEVLNENKMSQNELAKKLNVSPSTINDMCKKDIKRVNIETLSKVAEMFEIDDINEILTIEDDEQNEK